MTNKEIELKLKLLYEKTLRFDLLNYLEWSDTCESVLKEIQQDIIELQKIFIMKGEGK
jgi:hypothetical protein